MRPSGEGGGRGDRTPEEIDVTERAPTAPLEDEPLPLPDDPIQLLPAGSRQNLPTVWVLQQSPLFWTEPPQQINWTVQPSQNAWGRQETNNARAQPAGSRDRGGARPSENPSSSARTTPRPLGNRPAQNRPPARFYQINPSNAAGSGRRRQQRGFSQSRLPQIWHIRQHVWPGTSRPPHRAVCQSPQHSGLCFYPPTPGHCNAQTHAWQCNNPQPSQSFLCPQPPGFCHGFRPPWLCNHSQHPEMPHYPQYQGFFHCPQPSRACVNPHPPGQSSNHQHSGYHGTQTNWQPQCSQSNGACSTPPFYAFGSSTRAAGMGHGSQPTSGAYRSPQPAMYESPQPSGLYQSPQPSAMNQSPQVIPVYYRPEEAGSPNEPQQPRRSTNTRPTANGQRSQALELFPNVDLPGSNNCSQPPVICHVPISSVMCQSYQQPEECESTQSPGQSCNSELHEECDDQDPLVVPEIIRPVVGRRISQPRAVPEISQPRAVPQNIQPTEKIQPPAAPQNQSRRGPQIPRPPVVAENNLPPAAAQNLQPRAVPQITQPRATQNSQPRAVPQTPQPPSENVQPPGAGESPLSPEGGEQSATNYNPQLPLACNNACHCPQSPGLSQSPQSPGVSYSPPLGGGQPAQTPRGSPGSRPAPKKSS